VHVVLHRRDLDQQTRGDLLVRETLVDQADDLELAAGEDSLRPGARRAGRERGDAADERGGDPRRAQHLVAPRALDRGDEVVHRGLARDVAGDARLDTRQHLRLGLGHGEREDLHAGDGTADRSDACDGVGHRDVDEGDVRLNCGCELDRLVGIARRADDLEGLPIGEDGLDSLAVEPDVGDEENTRDRPGRSFFLQRARHRPAPLRLVRGCPYCCVAAPVETGCPPTTPILASFGISCQAPPAHPLQPRGDACAPCA
jgi:hypothetical protein